MTRASTATRIARSLAVGALVAASVIAYQGVATAVHDEEFQLDVPNANLTDDAASAQDFDWESFFNAAGEPSPDLPDASRPDFVASGFRADFALPDTTTFTQGSKDTLSIANDWVCTRANNVGDKVDILNAYAAAYIRPGDNHLILYYGVEKASPLGTSNIGVWFLKDGTVDCASPGGGAVDFTGGHVDGDILLVSEFSNGGAVATVAAYEWVGNDATGFLNTTPIASGQICGSGSDDACSTVNQGNFVDPPWTSPDKNGGNLDPLEFFEGGIDVGTAGADTCFATFLANTRTSTSLTSDKPDYARGSFPVCGELDVNKYIDVDMSGTNNMGDVTSGAPVTAWSFTVNGPAAGGGIGPVVCTGTTNSTGALVCATGSLQNLTPGTYRVTETQKTGFFNTDPGPGVNTAATVFKDVVVAVGGGSVELGNTCFVDKTFQITGAPSGVSSITVRYTVASGPNAGSTADVALVNQGAGTWSATVNDTLVQTNTIDWVWFINGDDTATKTGGTGDSLAGGAFPVCADTNSDTFPFSTLNGFKYKDVNNNGDFDGGTDLNGAGFTFDLKSGTTVLQTAVSGADGSYAFTNVAPGTYTVAERDETGWTQTEPAGGNSVDRTVVVPFNQASVTIGDFGNHPLSDISASFSAQASNPPGSATPATQSTITCTDSLNNVVASGTSSATGTSLPIGTYTCTIVITDP